ncbi:MAG: VOC family protein [Pseudomonadota bacterium]|nr:VOC family protein [Pseudomonadota bacterium]
MAHRSRLAGFVIDCKVDDLDDAAAFWGTALGWPVTDPGADDEPDTYREFHGTPAQLRTFVQKVDHPPRVHLDIESDDIDAEADRLEKLGAKRVGFVQRWWVMEAPSGHRFCVVKMHHPERGAKPNEWP